MVAAAAATRNPPRREDLSESTLPHLIPSEKDNAAALSAPRRPRTKEINSRYLSSCSSSSSSTTSTSYSSSTTISYSSSASSSSPRRFPSPLATPRPSSPPAPLQSALPRRSRSVDRTRPSMLRAAPEPPRAAVARALCITTRSLSVSFQGESFFYQTSCAKASSPSPARKATPERRRPSIYTPARNLDQSENSRPLEHHHHHHQQQRWPAAKSWPSNPLARSLDCTSEKKDSIQGPVHFLQPSLLFDDGTRRASFDGGDLSMSSDTDSVSSGSNSGIQELSLLPRAKATPRGISVPAGFCQENDSGLYHFPELGRPLSSPGSGMVAKPKLSLMKRSLVDSPLPSPRSVISPLSGPASPATPSKPIQASPCRGMASPLRARGSSVGNSQICQPGNAPSIISFAAEVRRAKNGENRIEEAHQLRLLDNRHLQWRCVNARASAAHFVQRLTAEKNLYNAWISTLVLHDSVTVKRIKLQLLTQSLGLTSILKGQMTYLEEWSLVDRDHSSSLSGAVEALKASTLRLPVVGGAKCSIESVKETVGSAVDVMQAMAFSICSILSKVEGANSLVSELAKVAAQERILLDQSRDLLSMVTAMQIKQCSLQGQILQLKRKPSQISS